MSALAITGCGVISAGGAGLEPLAKLLAGDCPAAPSNALDTQSVPKGTPPGLGTEPAEGAAPPEALPVAGLDVRSRLGRKGTGFLDRSTALALVVCDDAITGGGLAIDDSCRDRIGVVLGTTQGSLRSTMDYSRETLVGERPYLVNPALFPNTVMNCAAGQTAIHYGLKGVNATVAGGQLAFLQALRYARNTLRRGYADTLLVGACEELTDQTAWAVRLAQPEGTELPVGEGAAVFLVHGADSDHPRDSRTRAEVLAVTHGYAADGDAGAALRSCVGRGLEESGAAAEEVDLLLTGEAGEDRRETTAAVAVLGTAPSRVLRIKDVLGECQAATGALQLAAVLALHQDNPAENGKCALITGCDSDGGVAAAVVRRGSGGGTAGE